MNRALLLSTLLVQGISFAQVTIDRPLHFTGPPGAARIDGLAFPAHDDAALTVGVAASGMLHWATATVEGDTLVLSVAPEATEMADGLLLRFKPPAANNGAVWIRPAGHAALPLWRADALPLVKGELLPGRVAEIILANGVWTYLNASHELCPIGTVQVNERLCIDQQQATGRYYYEAVRQCGDRGGKLCSWGEYVAACSLVGTALSGMFDEWEWLDDTADHSHSALQAGLATCHSERSIAAFSIVVGDVRCCYHPR